jgi:cobalt/nickel transport system permease protein
MGTLVVRGVDRGERVAQAMRCRGFDGRFRTLTTDRLRWTDGAFAATVLIAFALLCIWDIQTRI